MKVQIGTTSWISIGREGKVNGARYNLLFRYCNRSPRYSSVVVTLFPRRSGNNVSIVWKKFP